MFYCLLYLTLHLITLPILFLKVKYRRLLYTKIEKASVKFRTMPFLSSFDSLFWIPCWRHTSAHSMAQLICGLFSITPFKYMCLFCQFVYLQTKCVVQPRLAWVSASTCLHQDFTDGSTGLQECVSCQAQALFWKSQQLV